VEGALGGPGAAAAPLPPGETEGGGSRGTDAGGGRAPSGRSCVLPREGACNGGAGQGQRRRAAASEGIFPLALHGGKSILDARTTAGKVARGFTGAVIRPRAGAAHVPSPQA